WRHAEPARMSLAWPPCVDAASTRRRLVLTGDSILYITGTSDPADNVAARLQALLDARDPGWCVINVAHSAYSAAQKQAALADVASRTPIDRAVWEVWGEGPTYARLGDDLYAVGSYARDADGFPWTPLPAPLNGWLFTHSRAWEYGALALGADTATEDLLQHHRRALDLAAARGFPIDFVFFPDLKGPFGSPPHTRHAVHAPLRALLAERGSAVADMGALLVGEDHEALRLDPCCHYNARGHDAVARALFAWLDARGALTPATAPPPEPPR
ncbi:MAG TPA: hypothetical protein PKA64_00405, partial [Myxococcota bacterium]|nr:hypothetical protein [Myxococcota bacterium]